MGWLQQSKTLSKRENSILYVPKFSAGMAGGPIRLYRHQQEAIENPGQKEKDRTSRQELKDLVYGVIVIRYHHNLEEQVQAYQDVFGE